MFESRYSDVHSEILDALLGGLNCRQKMMCESVCTRWRQTLRYPSKGLWGARARVSAATGTAWNVQLCSKELITPCQTREKASELRKNSVDSASFAQWLVTRLAGFDEVAIGCEQLTFKRDLYTLLKGLHPALRPTTKLHLTAGLVEATCKIVAHQCLFKLRSKILVFCRPG